MRRVIVARHGNTFEPPKLPRRIGSRTDLPLTAVGMAQSDSLGAHFAERGIVFSRALCGPLLRTRQSAIAILAHQSKVIPASVVDWLDEIDYGPDEDQLEESVSARIGPEALAAWDSDSVAPCDWIVDAEWRTRQWRSFFDEREQETFLLVTSSGAARYALSALRHSRLPASHKLATGAYGEIVCGPGGATELRSWNVRPLPISDPAEMPII